MLYVGNSKLVDSVGCAAQPLVISCCKRLWEFSNAVVRRKGIHTMAILLTKVCSWFVFSVECSKHHARAGP